MSDRSQKYKTVLFTSGTFLVLALGIMALDLVGAFRQWSNRKGNEKGMEPALLDSVRGGLHSGPLDERELAELNSDRYYNPGRTVTDPAYLLKVRQHGCIQQYLDSSRRDDDPNYEAVLHILLKIA